MFDRYITDYFCCLLSNNMKQIDFDGGSAASPQNSADTDNIFISTPNMVLHFPSPRVRRRHLSKISEERDDVTVKAQQEQLEPDDEQVRERLLVKISTNNNRAKNCKKRVTYM